MQKFGVLFNGVYDHAKLMGLAATAESSGYDALWYGDERFFRDTYVGLTACALATKRLRLAPAVSDPYSRHPASTAVAIASLDEVSGGRAMLGFGAGGHGFGQIGLKVEQPAAAVRDAIQVIRGLLDGETVSLRGVSSVIDRGQLVFAARQVPIYLSADGPMMLRLAGKMADGVILMHAAAHDLIAEKRQQVERGLDARELGHRPELVARLDVSVASDRERAMYQAKVRMLRFLWGRASRLDVIMGNEPRLPSRLIERISDLGPFDRTHPPQHEYDDHDSELYAPLVELVPDAVVHRFALAGTPSDVAAQLRALSVAGVESVIAYLLVPEGETMTSVMHLFAEAARTE